MKKLSALLIIMLPLFLSAQTNTVIVNASIKGLKPGTWLHYKNFDESISDSVKTVVNGFHFKQSIANGQGDMYILQIGKNYDEPTLLWVFLDKGTVSIKGNGPYFKNAKISGTPANEDYNNYFDFMKENMQTNGSTDFYKKEDSLYMKDDSVAIAALKPQRYVMDSMRNELVKQWVDEHTQSHISAFIMLNDLKESAGTDTLDMMMNALSADAKNNVPARKLMHSIEADKLTAIGKTAPDFSQPDTLGKPVALNDFRGKYVLVDFWASWCTPCREENPNVVKAYNTYKDKNFTVLSVSMDDEKKKWLMAIHKDGMPWNHVSDLQGWNNAAGKAYDIEAIPSNLLIDPSGKILAKNLRGEDLENKLKEIFVN